MTNDPSNRQLNVVLNKIRNRTLDADQYLIAAVEDAAEYHEHDDEKYESIISNHATRLLDDISEDIETLKNLSLVTTYKRNLVLRELEKLKNTLASEIASDPIEYECCEEHFVFRCEEMMKSFRDYTTHLKSVA